MKGSTPVKFYETTVHALMNAEPLEWNRPGEKSPVLFHPSRTGLILLRGADIVLAVDAMDKSNVVMLKGSDLAESGPDLPEGEHARALLVEVDFDTPAETEWLKVCIRVADDLAKEGRLLTSQ